MNYRKVYDALIYKRQVTNPITRKDGYCESHHIIPRCLGGSDSNENIVKLTAREHFIAHILLYRAVTSEYGTNSREHYKMLRALQRMYHDHRHPTFTSRKYDSYRREVSRIMSRQVPWNKGKHGIYSKEYRKKISEHHADVSGKHNPCYGKKGVDHPSYGRIVSEETRRRQSLLRKGRRMSAEARRKSAESHIGPLNGMYGKKFREYIGEDTYQKWRAKLSAAKKGKNIGSKNPSFGKRWVHNQDTKEILFVRQEDLNEYLQKGFKLGVGIKRGGVTKRNKGEKNLTET